MEARGRPGVYLGGGKIIFWDGEEGLEAGQLAGSRREGRLEDLLADSTPRDKCIYLKAIHTAYKKALDTGLAARIARGILEGRAQEAVEGAGLLAASIEYSRIAGEACTPLGLTPGSCRIKLLEAIGPEKARVRARLFFAGKGSLWEKSYPARVSLRPGRGFTAIDTRTSGWLDEHYQVSILHIIKEPGEKHVEDAQAALLAYSTGRLSSMWLLVASQLLSKQQEYRKLASTLRRAALNLVTGKTRRINIMEEQYHEAAPGVCIHRASLEAGLPAGQG